MNIPAQPAKRKLDDSTITKLEEDLKRGREECHEKLDEALPAAEELKRNVAKLRESGKISLRGKKEKA